MGMQAPLAEMTILSRSRSPVTSAMKELAKQSENDQAIWEHAQQSMSARAIDATIKLARAKCPADADRFDTNPWLLNFQNGTVDLRTGEDPREHERVVISSYGSD